MSSRIAACLCLVLWMSGCAWLQSSEVGVESGGQRHDIHEANDVALRLLPVDALRDDILMQQRVTVQWSDREESFDAVLQKRGQTLLLLGLGPMNSVGFRLTLDEYGVSFENRSGREMPFQPERILADVQRVFYPWIEGDSACVECDREGIRAGLEIRERIGARFLEERSFEIVGQPERGEVVVRYEGWAKDSLGPSRAVLHNGWFGYQLIIDTMSAERIESRSSRSSHSAID